MRSERWPKPANAFACSLLVSMLRPAKYFWTGFVAERPIYFLFPVIMYFICFLYSKLKDKYYVGFTGDDLIQRFRRHNSNHKGFTGQESDWSFIYVEAFADKSAAMHREAEIKNKKSRKYIERLVALPIKNRDGSAHPDL